MKDCLLQAEIRDVTSASFAQRSAAKRSEAQRSAAKRSENFRAAPENFRDGLSTIDRCTKICFSPFLSQRQHTFIRFGFQFLAFIFGTPIVGKNAFCPLAFPFVSIDSNQTTTLPFPLISFVSNQATPLKNTRASPLNTSRASRNIRQVLVAVREVHGTSGKFS